MGSVLDRTVESENWFAPMVLAHLHIPLNKGRGIYIETYGLDNVFPRDNPRFGSDTDCSWIVLLYVIGIYMHLNSWTCSSARIQTNQM